MGVADEETPAFLAGPEGAGNGADTATVPPPRLRIGLRVSLIAFAIFTVILTAAAVHLPWMFASRANVSEMADQISNEIVAGVSREIEDIFASAIAAQMTIERILADGTVDIENRAARESLSSPSCSPTSTSPG